MQKKKVQWYISEEEIDYLNERGIDCDWGSIFGEIQRKYVFFDKCVEGVNSRLDRMGEWIMGQSSASYFKEVQKSTSSTPDTTTTSTTKERQKSVKDVLDERGIKYTDKELSLYMTYVNPNTEKLNKLYYAVANEYDVCKAEYSKVGYVYDKSGQRGEMSWVEVIRDKGREGFDIMYNKLQEFK